MTEMRDLEARASEMKVDDEEETASYYKLREQLKTLGREFHSWLTRPQYIVPFMQSGRLVRVKHGDKDFGWGVVVNFKKVAPKPKENPTESETKYVVDALLHVSAESAGSKNPDQLVPFASSGQSGKGDMVAVPVQLNLIQQVSSVRIFVPTDLRLRDNRLVILKSIQEVHKRYGQEKTPLLDPVKDMKITDSAFKQVSIESVLLCLIVALQIVKKIAAFEERLTSHPLATNDRKEELLESYSVKAAAVRAADAAKAEVKKAKSLLQMSDLKCMKRVLRRLGYCTAEDVIEVKGRIACELSSADELLLTEMIFNGN